jgi:hypothetical protein
MILFLDELVEGEQLICDQTLFLVVLVFVEQAHLFQQKDLVLGIISLLFEVSNFLSELQDLSGEALHHT